MKDRFNIDEYGIFLVWLGIIFSLLAYFTHSQFVDILALVNVIYAIFRFFSSNKEKRIAENNQFKQAFLNPIKKSFKGFKNETVGDKNYKYVFALNADKSCVYQRKRGK
ncbi:hypothetical protein ACKRLN_00700 [Anaerococcus sp. DFU013_CI05]|uniref:hypothetical protein n=1 Tax=Anaerococcus sp. AH8042_DFU013_CI05 TaxID=3385202 RepID=UPI003A521549